VSGYVLIHRSLQKNKVFRDKTEAWAFADLIMQASWRQTTTHYKRRNIVLERGDLCISVRDFAAQWGRSKDWAKRFFDRLIEAKMVRQKRDSGATVGATVPNIVTICNYEKYQAIPKGAATVDETEARQRRDTEQYSNEEMKEENTPSGVSPPTAPKMPLKAAVDCWNEAAGRAGWKTILTLTGNREEQLRNRLREVGLDGWKAAIGQALSSDYLAGSDPPTWFTFDFIIKATNFSKLREGNYDRSRQPDERKAGHDRKQRGPTREVFERFGLGTER